MTGQPIKVDARKAAKPATKGELAEALAAVRALTVGTVKAQLATRVGNAAEFSAALEEIGKADDEIVAVVRRLLEAGEAANG